MMRIEGHDSLGDFILDPEKPLGCALMAAFVSAESRHNPLAKLQATFDSGRVVTYTRKETI